MRRLMIAILPAIIAGCASQPAPQPQTQARGALASLNGAYIARPISLYFAGLDTDGDSLTSRAEMQEGVTADWILADADGDQLLGAAELGAWSRRALGAEGAVPGFVSFDANGDRRVDRDEFAETLERRFAAFDSDSDGALSRAELVRQLVLPTPQAGATPRRRPRRR